MALSVTASHPETLFVVQSATLAWFLVRAHKFARPLGARALLPRVGSFVVAGALALLITSPLILSFFEYLRETYRFQTFSERDDASGSCYPAASLVGFVCPGVLGGPKGYWGPANLVWIQSLFSGHVPCLLAPLAFARRESRGVSTLVASLALVAGLLAFRGPLHDVAAHLPGLRVCALNHFAIVPNLGIVLLSGLGLGGLRSMAGRSRFLPALGLGFVALFLATWCFAHRTELRLEDHWKTARKAIAASLAVGLGTSLLALRPRRLFRAAVVTLAATELLYAKRGYHGTLPEAKIYPETGWAQAIRADVAHEELQGTGARVYRALGLPQGSGVSFTGVLPNSLVPYHIEDAGLSDPMYFTEYSWFVNATDPTGPMVYQRPGTRRPHLLDLAGVRYLLDPDPHRPRELKDVLLERGVRAAPDPRYMSAQTFDIDGDRRPVLFEHSQASIELTLPAAVDPKTLSFAVAVSPQAWDEEGDGVEFIVEAAPEEPVIPILSRYVDPKNRAEDRRWLDVTADLSPLAGRRAHLTLRTTSGPVSNDAFDFAVFGAPRVGHTVLDPAALAKAPHRALNDRYVESGVFDIGGDSRPILFLHPDSEVEVVVDVPADDPTFRAGLALKPSCWSPEKGDGVLFEVLARPERSYTTLYRRLVAPKSNLSDRAWLPGSADLSTLGTEPARLRLRTEPGSAGDNPFDHAGWADLALSPPAESVIGGSGGVSVTRRSSALPRALIVYDWLADQNRDLTRARILSGSTDLHRVVFVEGEAVPDPPRGTPLPGDDVTFEEYTAQRVVIDATARGEGYLVLFDSFARGWEATVDGEPAPILRADRCFRAVFLRAGRHVVTFRYRPNSFRLGLGLAAVGMVCLVGLMMLRDR